MYFNTFGDYRNAFDMIFIAIVVIVLSIRPYNFSYTRD
jgi:hypothetical protein